MDIKEYIAQCCVKYQLSDEFKESIDKFYESYKAAAANNGHPPESYAPLFKDYINYIIAEFQHPFIFESFHRQIDSCHQFALDFTRPIVKLNKSKINHLDNLETISLRLARGDNVILLGNHQTELDSVVISLMLEKNYPKISNEIIFVAGHRVVSDPWAIPFSKGCNLLCVFSKKYIDDDPEKKEERLLHNQRTMKKMSELLSEGGKCIYVAPSGGRDRMNRNKKVEVAAFDPQSIEMFWLMAQRADRPTHFYTLALDTYELLPPPAGIKKKLGEPRYVHAVPTHLAFGAEINMEKFPGSDNPNKKLRRKLRSDYIWNQVVKDYELISK